MANAQIKHAFTSAKDDGADNTVVQPSDWNADHTVVAGGSDTQVQFNDSNAINGDSGFTYSSANKTVDLGGGTVTGEDPVMRLTQTWNTATKSVTSLTSVSTTATATCTAHGFATGDRVLIAGAAQGAYNGTYVITVVDPNTFTYTFAGWGTPASGTITAHVLSTGLKVDITNTASAVGSTPIDVRVGGATLFSVGTSTSSTAGIRFGSATTGFKLYNDANAAVMTSFTGVTAIALRGDFTLMPESCALNWGNMSSFAATLTLAREASDVLAQRRTTNAQTFRLYNTYTDASNYERGKFEWASDTLKIGTEKAGTGTARNLELHTDGTSRILVGTAAITMQLPTAFNNNTIYGHRPTIVARTTDGTEDNAGRTITNRGATGTVTRTLQTYTDNIKFLRIASYALRVVPSSGKSFRRADGTVETANKYLELASDGAMVQIEYDGTDFLCVYERGTITVEP